MYDAYLFPEDYNLGLFKAAVGIFRQRRGNYGHIIA